MNNSIQEVLALKEHYLAIGQTEFYRSNEEPCYELVERVVPGGGYRLGIPISVYLGATIEGLRFRWNFDLEDRDANGTGGLRINSSAVVDCANRLNPKPRRELLDFLRLTVMPALETEAAQQFQFYRKQIEAMGAISRAIEEVDHPVVEDDLAA